MHKNVPVSPVSSCYIALTAMPVSTNIGYEKGTKCCICLIFITLMYNRLPLRTSDGVREHI